MFLKILIFYKVTTSKVTPTPKETRLLVYFTVCYIIALT